MHVLVGGQVQRGVQRNNTLRTPRPVAHALEPHLAKERHQLPLTVCPTLVTDYPIGAGELLDSRLSGAAQIQVPQQASEQLGALLRDTLFHNLPVQHLQRRLGLQGADEQPKLPPGDGEFLLALGG